MKSLIMMSILAAALQTGPAVFGQNPEQSARGEPRHHEQRFANLSADETQKLEAARQTAMKDPAVQAAHEKLRQVEKDFHDALNASMLKSDPSIQSILDKLPESRHRDF